MLETGELVEVERCYRLDFSDCPQNQFIVSSGFEKVSFEEFVSGDTRLQRHPQGKKMYDDIILPRRSTDGSAGYDFFIPYDCEIPAGYTYRIETGIRCPIANGWALWILPKSGLGIRYHVRLVNTIGLIDSDYYQTGHQIIVEVHVPNERVCESNNYMDQILTLNKGDKFCQGVFVPYGVTLQDCYDKKQEREGGFGSTGK